MDRPEPGLIRWSPSPSRDSFLHINVQHRVVQIYEPTGHAQKGRFDYRKLAKHDDLPPLTAYDWSPSHPGLVAVGTPTGVVNLLRVDDGSNAYLELNLKMARTCHAVAFNTTGKLAVALDRVRSDNCLYIWDVSRLSVLNPSHPGFPANTDPFSDPTDRLEPSVSVSSVRFFEDNPNVLVAGIKGQGLRIHDLREQSHGAAIHFPTKCCNNLAIDYADQNYFASSQLDQPGIMVWDRRATHRQDATSSYVDAVDRDGIPWGGALRLDRAVDMEADPALTDNKNSFVRSIRFCRDHRGMLAVLAQTGQLRILSTRHEYVDTDARVDGSPELLEVSRSHEMDPLYSEPSHKTDRIVSFDWITLRSPVVQPRLLVLRASGALEVLEKPSFTSEYPFKLIPWQAPYRGLEEGTPYHTPLELEPPQAHSLLSPLFTERALSDIPLFGSERPDINALVDKVISSHTHADEMMDEMAVEEPDIPAAFLTASSIAEKLAALRLASQDASSSQEPLSTNTPSSQLQRHEMLLTKLKTMSRVSHKVQAALDHTMLLRAKEGYLFNYTKNQEIVADDSWLRDVWAWVAGAEEAASDSGMISHPIDIGYLGVSTIWTNDLGAKLQARLEDGAPAPDRIEWERCINTINKKLGVPKFDLRETRWPHHRELCMEICNWGRPDDPELHHDGFIASPRKDSTWYTLAAARSLFKGDIKSAVRILAQAGPEHQELLFVSLSLQLISKNKETGPKELDFDEHVIPKTDPYLRAISTFITTGDWDKIANQRSLPLRDRVLVAVRHYSDDELTTWLDQETTAAIQAGDLQGIILTGISDQFVELLARYVEKFYDYQTATLLLSICAPRFIDDVRAAAFRSAYRAYLQRHHAFFLRAKFDVESTKRSKHRGRPTLRPPGRQIALRCVYCDAETSLNAQNGKLTGTTGSLALPSFMGGPPPSRVGSEGRNAGNPFTDKMAAAGISCPNCKRHLPRCVVCLEVVGMPRSDRPEMPAARAGASGLGGPEVDAKLAGRFPTFCLKCEHVLHLDHARQWFARHQECPVPECRCKCNFRANPELNYR